MNKNIEVSKEFKNTATKAIISIILFLLFYITILSAAIYGVWLAIQAGVAIITNKPTFGSLFVGILIIGFTVSILFFLIKFAFKSNKYNRSKYVEITKEDEPKLFAFVNEIVIDVGVDFPKKIYLTNEVNACVFYDSNFLSMFMPVRKNLMLGLGLINTCTELELKAIIAHEFGHFSQRSMKMGSYVSNVNHIIFNMLYDNEGYNNFINKASNIHGFITLLVFIIQLVILGIKWVLIQLYGLVNKSYLALSKQMEYHADEVAATLVGYKSLETSLYRMELADQAYDSVLNIYVNQIKEHTRSENIFLEQSYILTELGKENDSEFHGGLPLVKEGDTKRFNRSKIEFSDHWNSHPSTLQRIEKLKSLYLIEREDNLTPAGHLFKDFTKTQVMLTDRLFDEVSENKILPLTTLEQFKQYYQQYIKENTFNKFYSHYYDYNNIKLFDLETASLIEKPIDHLEIYNMVNTELSLQLAGLYDDHRTMNDLIQDNNGIEYLHYNKEKYLHKHFKQLNNNLIENTKDIENRLKSHDIKVYQYFLHLEGQQHRETDSKLKAYYQDLFDEDVRYDKRMEYYNQVMEQTAYLAGDIDLDKAKVIINQLNIVLKPFKEEMQFLLELEANQKEITLETAKYFNDLIDTKTFLYGNKLNEVSFEALINCLDTFKVLTLKHFFYMKKRVLDYQITLL
ncbi:M48 family metallopeptidase [Myroides sp. M-43]|uniref:M48 family metalloprotease n=1 Tax=Myroides oncorhynchi TaxID=2893756 RepID=UPI001E41AC26|nr:M48 family metallopeptidase [Myroides oncorhynchi]MCC9043341.1 M48 family metallopeptidase [Myroides oncorhynchi]